MKKIMIGAALVLGMGLLLSPVIAVAAELPEGNDSAMQYVPLEESSWTAPMTDAPHASGSGENSPTQYVPFNGSLWTTPAVAPTFAPTTETQSQIS